MGHNDCLLTYRGKKDAKEVLASPRPALAPLRSTRVDAPWRNILISGDNLEGLSGLLEIKLAGRLGSADGTAGARLVYIDPPFSTMLEFKARQNQPAYGDKARGAEFIEGLRARLILLKEILADNGSIFVHLDWKMAHYVKVVMDELFGEENFLNDIVWHYGGRGAKHIAGQFSRNHDIILWYRKGPGHVFNQLTFAKRVPKKGSGFRQDDAGRWFKTSPKGDYTDTSMEALAREGRVYTTRNGTRRVKYFLREDGEFILEDKLVGDVWDDIPDAMHLAEAEKTGYPTQKPEALLERIIRAASGPGDLVLDCYAGSGTTLCAAEKLGRRWAGVDSGVLAIHTIEKRLLAIGSTKSLDTPKKRYSKACRPFDVLGTAPAGQNAGGQLPSVKCACGLDETTGERLVRILEFSSPGAGLGGMDALSSVAVDLAYDGRVMRTDAFFTKDELEKAGFELRLAARKATGELLMVFTDICGSEKRLAWEPA